MRVSVCVWERERERATRKDEERKREREREKERGRWEQTPSNVGNVLLPNALCRWTEAPVSPVIINSDGHKEEQVICNVLDLLPETFHAQHLRFTGKVMETGQLPRTLEHPLRAVEMKCKDGSKMQVSRGKIR